MQAASGSSAEKIRGSPSAMEKGGDQSAKKPRMANGPAPASVKQEMVVLGHEAGEIVLAIQPPTMEVLMDLTLLQCHFYSRPLKPPVHQCNNGHVACGDCRGGERLGNERQCQKCERGGGFYIHNTAIDVVVSAARVECAHHGCGLFATFHELEDQQGACRHRGEADLVDGAARDAC
ncbi:E3 ubiquitin-protein ligase SINA-like 5 [Triticum aestivum]|uniref:E3 ubiquitin-protein ligase SINA-like 5 n=1 Tax=Triticum aestivum TaxID=4565 RepID=UPI001D00F36B|nr:E3 ubiquitin-protein ligase SINA-like 5 [Triticum aestivum]